MLLSRIELAPDASTDAAFWRDVGTPYGAHQALWRLFRRTPDQRRDFLFREEQKGSRPSFFTLSQEAPVDEEGLWRVESRPFSPRLAKGDRLAFSLRASPTVQSRVEGKARSSRHDVVMAARHAAKQRNEPFDEGAMIQSEGASWLQKRSEAAGFRLESGASTVFSDDGLLEEQTTPALRVDGYRQHRLARRGEKPLRYSTLDFEGTLVVTDPECFVARVASGFGPQKAFGCGLMLLRRA